MAASVQFRPQNRDLGMIMREVDDDLAIFLGMRNADKERNDPPADSDDFNESQGLQPKPNCSPPLNETREHIVPIAAEDHFLNFDTEKDNYNWQPDSSLLDPIEVNVQPFPLNAPKTLQNEAVSDNSEVDNSSKNSDSQTESPLHQDPPSTNTNVSAGANKRPLLSFKPRKPSPRPSPPTARSTLPAKPRPTRLSNPTSRPALTSSSKPSSRSSTPLRTSSRPSTPNSSRPSGPIPSRPGPRPSTPMRGKPHPATVSKAPQDPPKASGPARPASASRGRANRHDEKPKRLQKSCSPPKMRPQNGGGSRPRGPNSSTVLVRGRGGSNDGEEVNPVLMGTKMVDMVVSMRKLAPPKQDECVSQDNSWRKPSGLGNSGFGRSLSKKSLDMAIRHMGIRRSMCEN